MLNPTFQLRAPSKRRMVLAGVLVISLVSIAWSFGRFVLRAGDFKAAPALGSQKAENAPLDSGNTPSADARLIDSDNDGIPDIAELRTFQDRDSFRRWFTAIAEIQFYQLSDQWNAEQRDCAGLSRFSIREALRHHDRAWFQKMGPGYETVAADVSELDIAHNPVGEKIFRTDF